MAIYSDPSANYGKVIVFYHEPGIVVTDRYIENRDGLYPLPELHNIHRFLGDGGPRSRWMEVRADYAGRRITLFSSRNRSEFEKVRWAIVRAVEANRPLRP